MREAAHGVDIVRALAQGAAQRLDRLGLPARAHVIERGRDPALVDILFEELLECRIRLVAAAQRSECLAKLAVHEWQARLQANGLAETRLRLCEALLHREDAAEILVQMREIRLERDRLTHDLLRFSVACLFHEGVTEQAQVVDAAGTLHEVLATDGLCAVRAVHAQRLAEPFRSSPGPLLQVLVEPSKHALRVVLLELRAPVAMMRIRVHDELRVDAAAS